MAAGGGVFIKTRELGQWLGPMGCALRVHPRACILRAHAPLPPAIVPAASLPTQAWGTPLAPPLRLARTALLYSRKMSREWRVRQTKVPAMVAPSAMLRQPLRRSNLSACRYPMSVAVSRR